MITLRAKDYRCVCGKKGEFLNITFGDKWGNALCEKCRDIAVKEKKMSKEEIIKYLQGIVWCNAHDTAWIEKTIEKLRKLK